MKKTIVLGVDNGNKATKSSAGLAYESGIVESLSRPLTDDHLLQFGGRYYIYGTGRMPLLWDKASSEDAFLLTLPAIAHAAQAAGIQPSEPFDVFLGVGLPIATYSAQKGKWRAYFLGRGPQSVVWRGGRYDFTVSDCRVYPQGYAAYVTAYERHGGFRVINVVDIGGYTIEAFRVSNGRVEAESSTPLNSGVIKLFNAIRDEMVKQGYNLREVDIEDIVSNGFDGRDDIDDLVRSIARRYVLQLLGSLRERGFELRLPTLFIGGGAELFASVLREDRSLHIIEVLDRFANARGYELLARQEWNGASRQ